MDFWLLLEIWKKNIGKIRSNKLSTKYSQKLPYQTKQSATDALKTASKKALQKNPDATADLIGNKVCDTITKSWKTSQQNNSVTKYWT